MLFAGAGNFGQYPVIAGAYQPDFCRLFSLQGCCQRCAQGLEWVLAQLQILQGQGFHGQFGSEVTHGAQKQGDALFVRPDVGGFLYNFSHPQAVKLRVEILENG